MNPPRPARRVLHLVDRVTGGVPIAVRTYVENSPPGYRHIVASPFMDDAPAPVWGDAAVEHRSWDTASPARAVRSLRRLLSDVPADVVHAHSSFPGFYARLLLSRPRQRLVYTPHCYAFSRTDVAPVVRAAFRVTERVLAARTPVLAACGPGEQRDAVALGIAASRTLVVPNVASLVSRSAPVVDGLGVDGRLRVGMMGRGAAQKDPAYFVRRVGELRRALPDAAVDATWIGDGGDLGRDIRVTGWVTSDSVAEELRELDVYIHSAAWEGFPIALLDAFAIGLPMLARPIAALPGLPEALTVEGGLEHLVRSIRSDGFAVWRHDNRARWEEYLGPRTPDAQGAALARAWG